MDTAWISECLLMKKQAYDSVEYRTRVAEGLCRRVREDGGGLGDCDGRKTTCYQCDAHAQAIIESLKRPA